MISVGWFETPIPSSGGCSKRRRCLGISSHLRCPYLTCPPIYPKAARTPDSWLFHRRLIVLNSHVIVVP
jgi:hypothetical protein